MIATTLPELGEERAFSLALLLLFESARPKSSLFLARGGASRAPMTSTRNKRATPRIRPGTRLVRQWGDQVHLVNVQTAGDEINTFLSKKLSKIKLPRKFAFVETLPRNAHGKVLKNELRVNFACMSAERRSLSEGGSGRR